MTDGINEEILLELRKLKRATYLIMVFVLLSILPAFYYSFRRAQPAANSWDTVNTAMRRQDFRAALSQARSFVTAQPYYHYGHAYLGAIYLAMGDVTNAHTCYLHAYELFPNEQNEKDLDAVRKRLSQPPPMKLLSN
jgi:cytochrome c-type biogenesis protein CcmH/NrfG